MSEVLTSITRLELALAQHEHMSGARVHHTVTALLNHGIMCKAKTDARPETYRDFCVRVAKMTRSDRYYVANIVFVDAHATMSAACDALHDLIMEGV